MDDDGPYSTCSQFDVDVDVDFERAEQDATVWIGDGHFVDQSWVSLAADDAIEATRDVPAVLHTCLRHPSGAPLAGTSYAHDCHPFVAFVHLLEHAQKGSDVFMSIPYLSDFAVVDQLCHYADPEDRNLQIYIVLGPKNWNIECLEKFVGRSKARETAMDRLYIKRYGRDDGSKSSLNKRRMNNMTRSFHTILLLAGMCQISAAFSPPHPAGKSRLLNTILSNSRSIANTKKSRVILSEICNNDHDGGDAAPKIAGDPLRAASGVRPSLHPITINALALALKIRAVNFQKNPDESLTPGSYTAKGGSEVTVAPMDVALRAAKIAANAIAARQASSDQDGMTLVKAEEETIAGRVVGVVMRFDSLESELCHKVKATAWIAKYGDWDSYGVLAEECKDDSGDDEGDVRQRITDDPLFAMTRAECLLALFLETVETPALEKAGQSVPDKGNVDFLDEDRKEVLLKASS